MKLEEPGPAEARAASRFELGLGENGGPSRCGPAQEPGARGVARGGGTSRAENSRRRKGRSSKHRPNALSRASRPWNSRLPHTQTKPGRGRKKGVL